jgi:hypothetical protein
MPPSRPCGPTVGKTSAGAGAVDENCPSELGKIGGGVTQGEAGMFWGEDGSGDRKIGGCQAIAPARLAGMSAQ